MAKRAQEQEHENLERWLVSYADFITLLFAFFVVMYSISSINEGKYRVLSDSLVAAFRSPTKTIQPIQLGKPSKSPLNSKVQIRQAPFAIQLPEMPLPWLKDENLKGGPESESPKQAVDRLLAKLIKEHRLELSDQDKKVLNENLEMLYNAQAAAAANGEKGAAATGQNAGPAAGVQGLDMDQVVVMKKIASNVQQAMQKLIDKNLIAVRRTDLWVEVEIKASVLFESGKAEVSVKAVPVLTQLARILSPFPNMIRVEGFTDNVPIHNERYPSNWELSGARASSVVRLLAAHGIEPRRLVAVGYGKYAPVADNDTAEGRRKNRRVVLVVLANNGKLQPVKADLLTAGSADETAASPAPQSPPLAGDGTATSGGGTPPVTKPAPPAGSGTGTSPPARNAESAAGDVSGPSAPLPQEPSGRKAQVIVPPVRFVPPIQLAPPLRVSAPPPLPVPRDKRR